MLHRTGTDHDDKAGPLESQRPTRVSIFPPFGVLLDEACGVDNVVVKVDVGEKILDQSVCTYALAGEK